MSDVKVQGRPTYGSNSLGGEGWSFDSGRSTAVSGYWFAGADLGRESETRVWVNVNDTIMFSATFTTIPLKFLIPHFTVNHTVKFHRESHTAVVK